MPDPIGIFFFTAFRPSKSSSILRKTEIEAGLNRLFLEWAGKPVSDIEALPPSGSDRQYYRLTGSYRTAIGTYNHNVKENAAFLTFARHFHGKGLPVAEILGVDKGQELYIQEDLGDRTLFKFLTEETKGQPFPVAMYKRAIDELPRFQVLGHEGLDYSVCYPRDVFDKPSMMWDLNYFKYYFAKLAHIEFDEQPLQDDFDSLTDLLSKTDSHYFLYRDFQARNIMLREGQPYFIDFQGGRRGPLQYDLVSLLYQAKANIPQEIRDELLEYYLDVLSRYNPVDRALFVDRFYGFVLIRTLQVLGAYGFRGFYERREHFLASVPYAVKNIEWLLKRRDFSSDLPELHRVLHRIIDDESLRRFGPTTQDNRGLTVTISSFSYKQGIPVDESGNGGGFVFDCRAIENPGKLPAYRYLTGRDQPVIHFLQKQSDAEDFMRGVYELVDKSVERYLSRNFTHLAVNFGCTGGQHRSVYCADRLAEHLEFKYNVSVHINHIEQEKKGWINTP